MKKREAQSLRRVRLALVVSLVANIILVAGIGIYLFAQMTQSPVDRYNRAQQEYKDLCARPEVLDRVAAQIRDQRPSITEAQNRVWIGYDCGERAHQGAYAADLNKELKLRGLPALDN